MGWTFTLHGQRTRDLPWNVRTHLKCSFLLLSPMSCLRCKNVNNRRNYLMALNTRHFGDLRNGTDKWCQMCHVVCRTICGQEADQKIKKKMEPTFVSKVQPNPFSWPHALNNIWTHELRACAVQYHRNLGQFGAVDASCQFCLISDTHIFYAKTRWHEEARNVWLASYESGPNPNTVLPGQGPGACRPLQILHSRYGCAYVIECITLQVERKWSRKNRGKRKEESIRTCRRRELISWKNQCFSTSYELNCHKKLQK